jgi:CBS domain-containing protein
MQVKERMTPAAHCCRPDDRLTTAARLMWEHDCGCIPVVDERNVLVGMVTDRDACMAAYTRGLRLDEIPVHTVMAKRAFACKADDTIEAAEVLMRSHQIRRLPVVDSGNKVIGVLSSMDLVRIVAQASGQQRAQQAEQLLQTLAAIGAPRQLGTGAKSVDRPASAKAMATAPATAPAVALPRPAETRTETRSAPAETKDKTTPPAGKPKGKR